MLYIISFAVLYGIFPFVLVLLMNNKSFKIREIIPFTIVVFVASLYEFFVSILFRVNVEHWFLIYNLLAFISINYFYFVLLKKKYTHFIVISTILFLIFYIINVINSLPYNYLEISSFFNAYQTLAILFFSILWFKKNFKELEIDNMLENPTFYFISGLLIYYCGSVVLFLLSSSIYAADNSQLQFYWLLNVILNLVLRTLLIVGIWKAR